MTDQTTKPEHAAERLSRLMLAMVTADADGEQRAMAEITAAGWRVVPAKRGSHDNSIVKDAMTNATRDPHQITEWFAGTNHTVITVCDVGETYFLPEAMDE